MTKNLSFGLISALICLFLLSSFNVALCSDNTGNDTTFFTMKEIFKSGNGKIIGTIVNTKGEAVADVSIIVQEMEAEDHDHVSTFSTIDSVKTNSKGKFKIRRVPVGTYKVVANPADGSGYLSNDVWNVNVFARKSAVVDMKLSASIPDGTSYIGSSACKICHGSDHSGWIETAHAKAHLTPSADSVVAPFDDVLLKTVDDKVKFRVFVADGIYKVTVIDLNDDAVSETYEVARTHGGVAKAGKQRFQVKLGNSYYLLPIQYNNRNVDAANPDASWVSYHPERWYGDDGTLRVPDSESHSFEQNCEGCHATGVSVKKNGNEFVSSSKELGIGCERCHGPGGLHASTGGGNGNNIINPEYLSVKTGTEVCSQCHTRVVSMPGANGANFETGYPAIVNGDEIKHFVIGNDLDEYQSLIKLSGKDTPGFWNDNDASFGENASANNHSKKHHQQALDFEKSHHSEIVGLKCFDCHATHNGGSEAPQLRLSNNSNALCLSCHPDKEEMGENVANGDVLNVHTKHVWDPTGSKASRCSGCHLPKTAKSAVDADIHSHVFDIIKPAISLAMAEKNTAAGIVNDKSTVIMNACFSCHSNDEDYGAGRWLAWERMVVE